MNEENKEVKLNAHAKYIADRLDDVQQAFRRHKATRMDLDEGVIIIDWKRPNECAYATRYLFDTKAGNLTISGDIGFCVLHTCWGETGMQPEHVAASFSTTNLQYFLEKVMAVDHEYYYHDKSFLQDVEHWLGHYREDIRDYLKSEEDAETDEDGYISDKAVDSYIHEIEAELYDAFTNERGIDKTLVEDHLKSKLEAIDVNWEYELEEAGKEYDAKLYYWVIGLLMAIQDLDRQEHVADGAATAEPESEAKA